MGIIWMIIVGAVAGWLAGMFTTGSGYGFAKNIILGIIGSIVGGFLFWLLQLQPTGLVGEVVTSTIGAVLFLYWLRKTGK